MPTLLWDVRSALVSVYRRGLTGVDVFDGPMTRTTPPARFLLVGTEGDFPAAPPSDDGSSAQQDPATLSGSTMRDETGRVVCAAWAWSGETDFAPLRAAVRTIVDAAEGLVADDRTLGGIVNPPGFAQFTALRIREEQTTRGAFVRATFTVAYGALVTT